MPNKEGAAGSGDIWLGIFFLGTACLVLLLSGSIHSIGLGDNFDPGPKAFPIGLSALLAIGGVVEILKRNPIATPDRTADGNKQTILYLLAAFLAYVVLLPWLGFALSTAIMATGMMVLLGNSWKAALLLSAILILIIYLLFVVLFRVPLPGGLFGMPF